MEVHVVALATGIHFGQDRHVHCALRNASLESECKHVTGRIGVSENTEKQGEGKIHVKLV